MSTERATDQAESPGREEVEQSLIELLTASVLLTRQVWRERWALLKAETRLAFKSALWLAFLLAFTAVAAGLLWASLLGIAAFGAWQLGLHWGWIALGLVLAQLILLWGVRGLVRQCLRWLSFPASRAALRPPSAPDVPSSSGRGESA